MPKKSILDFQKMKKDGERVTWITAYDFPFSVVAERAGVDMILVGDSGTMVNLGFETTNPATMDEMILMSKAARRGAPNTFICGDMPQGSYEISNEDAVRNALRFVKEAACDAVKLEGGIRVADRIKAINNAGILVFNHLGLTPMSAASFGGYKVQGKSKESLQQIKDDALAGQEAGACALLLESMPELSAGYIRDLLKIPVYGIGAGKNVDGQLLIIHDLLGLYPAFRPYFAKCFISDVIDNFKYHLSNLLDAKESGRKNKNDGLLVLATMAVENYVRDVKKGTFPSLDYCYQMTKEQEDEIKEFIRSSSTSDSLLKKYLD